jgi:hypothetical protein
VKKRASHKTTSLFSVKLYRNDLDDILTLLETHRYTKDISDAKNEYMDLADLEHEKGTVIRDLSINGAGDESSLKLHLGKGGITLEVNNDDGLYFLLKALLRSKTRIGLGIFVHLFVGFAIVGFFTIPRFLNDRFVPLSVLALLASAFLLAGWYAGGFSVVYLTQKHLLPSIWKRNKDTILVATISAFVSAALTFAITYYFFLKGCKP